ncbi:MAG: nicotinamide-nucleotide adenylyltransferase [Herpetosiphon sp.]
MPQPTPPQTPQTHYACVHGRFQPFHNEHLAYILQATEHTHRLIVGITNADPHTIHAEETSAHRHLASANPFSYWERMQMIEQTLTGRHWHGLELSFIPFPIHDLSILPTYLPPGVIHFVRVFSSWEQEKVRRLTEAGCTVTVLPTPEGKTLSASDIRSRIRRGLPYDHLVPTATHRMIEALIAADPKRMYRSPA